MKAGWTIFWWRFGAASGLLVGGAAVLFSSRPSAPASPWYAHGGMLVVSGLIWLALTVWTSPDRDARP